MVEAIEKRVADAGTSLWQQFVTTNSDQKSAVLKLTVECFDAFGGVVRTGSVIQPRRLLYIAAVVSNVRTGDGGTIGAVMYGNTFLMTGMHREPINLTQTIPVYRAWVGRFLTSFLTPGFVADDSWFAFAGHRSTGKLHHRSNHAQYCHPLLPLSIWPHPDWSYCPWPHF